MTFFDPASVLLVLRLIGVALNVGTNRMVDVSLNKARVEGTRHAFEICFSGEMRLWQ
jgi:hypothetical protein